MLEIFHSVMNLYNIWVSISEMSDKIFTFFLIQIFVPVYILFFKLKYEHDFMSFTHTNSTTRSLEAMVVFFFFLQHLWTLMVEESDLLGQLKVNKEQFVDEMLLLVHFCFQNVVVLDHKGLLLVGAR